MFKPRIKNPLVLNIQLLHLTPVELKLAHHPQLGGVVATILDPQCGLDVSNLLAAGPCCGVLQMKNFVWNYFAMEPFLPNLTRKKQLMEPFRYFSTQTCVKNYVKNHVKKHVTNPVQIVVILLGNCGPIIRYFSNEPPWLAWAHAGPGHVPPRMPSLGNSVVQGSSSIPSEFQVIDRPVNNQYRV